MKEIDDILNLMEAGAEFNDEQLQQLLDDADSRAVAEDIVLAQHVLTPAPDDIEERLEAFHKKHNGESSPTQRDERRRKIRIISLSILAVAAVFIGAVFIMRPTTPENYLFKAEENVCAQLSDKQGTPIKLRLHKQEGEVDPIVLAEECSKVEDNGRRDTVTLTIPQGSSYRLDLADGTRVYLYPGSTIEYPNHFGKHSRDVQLQGEAYFVVSKDSNRPFTVSTQQSVTSVLGTEFHIISKAGKRERLTLVNGHVRFTGKHNAETVDVFPGQEVTVNDYGNLGIEMADTMEYVSWRDGFMYYDNSELGDILHQIGRQFNVNIICKNPSILKLHMHFVFRRDQDINDAVQILNKMKKVSASINGNNLIVK